MFGCWQGAIGAWEKVSKEEVKGVVACALCGLGEEAQEFSRAHGERKSAEWDPVEDAQGSQRSGHLQFKAGEEVDRVLVGLGRKWTPVGHKNGRVMGVLLAGPVRDFQIFRYRRWSAGCVLAVVGLIFKIGPARRGAAGAWATLPAARRQTVPVLGANLAQHGMESPETVSTLFFLRVQLFFAQDQKCPTRYRHTS